MNQILFLCTGNYYRSRFAEYMFNHYAQAAGLPWRAVSRGLAIELLEPDAGPLSPHTRQALTERGLMPEDALRFPMALHEDDLHAAHTVIALKHAEHYPLMQRKFPHWAERITYWHIHDIDCAQPAEALPQIEELVVGVVRATMEKA